MSSSAASAPTSLLRATICDAHLADEAACVERLLREAAVDGATRWRIDGMARRLVAAARQKRLSYSGLDAFLREYDLSSQEGVVLMCLAEALLRIPDAETADRLIHDKLAEADWQRHLGHSHSFLVNASTWGLMLTGELIGLEEAHRTDAGTFLGRLVARSGEPLVRVALKQAMNILAGQFVMGRTIEEALQHSLRSDCLVYRYSFDMLGEAALSRADVERYFEAYSHALRVIAATSAADDLASRPGVSVKLSALHPRFEYAQRDRVMAELPPRLAALAELAAQADIGLTVDAEEADRLDLTLDVFEAVFRQPNLSHWQGLGLAVQAYQKRALPVLDWLADLARHGGRRIPVRLVKGAYWDTEIKRAQVQGLKGYPVFTRKAATDTAYLACVKHLFANHDAFYPQFATHNAHTMAYVLEMARNRSFEFQRLYGMGDALYSEVAGPDKLGIPCRVYAPVGGHRELLPYLVRRLLENGANTSFVNRIADEKIPLERVVASPIEQIAQTEPKANPRLPPPCDLYRAWRNSAGLALDNPATVGELTAELGAALNQTWTAAPLVGGTTLPGEASKLENPADRRQIVGEVAWADEGAVERALSIAAGAAADWDCLAADTRAGYLERAAELIEDHRAELMALAVREGGRCILDALSEVREAADYCRYYAHLARRDFGEPETLPGPVGESNRLRLHGRGVFACISPWNFPLAIFTSQVTAALAAGNAVIAKPASQTPLTAMFLTRLLHQAGVPGEVLHLLPGEGARVGMALVADRRIGGVAMTGATATAQLVNRTLAARDGAIPVLIAETGGQNAMIVDSSALPEQVAVDAVQSAFNSAGQRCSALRVLFVQEEIADRVIALLQGAMAELRVGDPALLSTDVGPVIGDAARTLLEQHAARIAAEGTLLFRAPLPDGTGHGSFFPPCAFEIPDLALLEHEVFGPILHVIRYTDGAGLDRVIDAINATGYGLTCGIHSRIDETVEHLRRRIRAGNLYVNRNMIGAVVGVQPFGGEGLSGTGPKAGGPHYLRRFAVERSVAVNTAAIGGNAALLAGDGEGP